MLKRNVTFVILFFATVILLSIFPLRIYAEESVLNKEIASILHIRKLLEEKKFQELTSLLESYETDFEKGLLKEDIVSKAFDSFDITYSRYETLFNDWQKVFPESFSPYLAQAIYYHSVGWIKRGHAFVKDTIDLEFKGMDESFIKAKDAAKLALQLNPKLIKAYRILIDIAKTQRDSSFDTLVKKSLELFPTSFSLRSTCMHCLLPRWGGSYEKMEEFASEAEKFVDIEPKMKLLRGFIDIDKAGFILSRFKDIKEYIEEAVTAGIIDKDEAKSFLSKNKEKDIKEAVAAKAVTLCTMAFAYGEYWEFYSTRAYAYRQLDKKQEAIKDLNRSIVLNPTYYYDYIVRSYLLCETEKINEAVEDLHLAELLSPDEPEVKNCKDWMVKDLIYKGHKLAESGDLAQAMQKYNISLGLDPNNVEGLYWRGRAELKQGDFDRALKDFNSAIENDPHHFESYRNIDWLLARNGNWDRVIQLWNGFIALEPNNAKAYLERGGANLHKGDRQAALKDAKKACELGNSEACMRYNQIK